MTCPSWRQLAKTGEANPSTGVLYATVILQVSEREDTKVWGTKLSFRFNPKPIFCSQCISLYLNFGVRKSVFLRLCWFAPAISSVALVTPSVHCTKNPSHHCSRMVSIMQKQMKIDEEELEQLSTDKQRFLVMSVQSYIHCLEKSDAYDLQVIIWLPMKACSRFETIFWNLGRFSSKF